MAIEPDRQQVRGIAARRHDTPEYVRGMQRRMFEVMARATTVAELGACRSEVVEIFRETVAALPAADPKLMAIGRRISRTTYRHRCLEGAAVQAYRDRGIEIEPGMKIEYVVTDAKRYCVEPAWEATTFDAGFYRTLLERAQEEILAAYKGEDHHVIGGGNWPGSSTPISRAAASRTHRSITPS